ncbi:MAG TPA: hypothetical protein P5137_17385, partial [Candidatus Brocadiia bacterium]|nr:hypothetical protein [Candidatus Brocadiia bacterium]
RERVFVASSLIFGVALCACMVAWLSRKQEVSVRLLMRKVETLQKQLQTPAQTATAPAAPGQAQPAALAALGSPAEALRRGAQLFDEGRYADAIPYFDAATRNAATPAPAYYLGLCCLRTRDSLRATRLLRSIVTSNPSSPYAVRSLYWLGREALESGNPWAALRLFSGVMAQEDVLTAEDGEIIAGALYGLGETYAMCSDRAESEEQAVSGRASTAAAAPPGAPSKEAKP